MVVGITFGAFDMVHPGHILLFKEAKEVCDWLIVGLHRDPSIERSTKNKPLWSLEERKIALKANKYIDQIIEYDTEQDVLWMLNNIKPDIRIIGSDYQDKDFTGKGIVPVHFHERNHDWSSTAFRKRHETCNSTI